MVTVFLFLSAGCASVPSNFEIPDDHTALSLEQTLRAIENERLIFIGEAHDSASDHLFQLEVLRYLRAKGKKVAVAMELFPKERQQILSAWAAGALDQDSFERECDRIWDDFYEHYGNIFGFARSTGIGIIGIGTAKGLIALVGKDGMHAVSTELKEKLHFIGCGKDPEYDQLMMSLNRADLHKEKITYFCDSQRFADTMMALNILDILEDNNITVVVLAGAAHASKIAVPRILSGYRPVTLKVLLPASFRDLLGHEVSSIYADFIWY